MAEILDMTDEMRAKMDAAYRPIPAEGTFPYVPLIYRTWPIEKRPVFMLKRMDGLTLLRSEDKLFTRVYGDDTSSNGARVEISRGAFMAYICVVGIVGWRNYYDLTYVKDQHEKLIGRLPPDLLREIANAITERQEMTDDEKRGLE